MKLANIKSMLVKGVTVGLLAGAVVLATPAKANAAVGCGRWDWRSLLWTAGIL